MAKDAKGHGSEKRGLTSAAQEKVALNKAADKNLYHKADDDRKVPAHQEGVNAIPKAAPPITEKAHAAIAEGAKAGGFSVTPRGESPTSGHMVALPGRTLSVPTEQFKANPRSYVEPFVKSNADVFRNPAMHVVGGEHEGRMHIDPSENIPNREKAIAACKERNQIEIWDVKHNRGIPTGGTGK
jgi:hypothetical protein